MFFFVTIITDDLAGVAAVGAVLLFLTVVGISGIHPSSQCGAFSGTTIPFISAIVLLLLFPKLLVGVSAIGALRSWHFQFLRSELRFLNYWVLYWLGLGTSFGC